MNYSAFRFVSVLLIVAIVLLGFSACNSPTTTLETPQPASDATASPIPTEIPQPTETPQPGKVILVSADALDTPGNEVHSQLQTLSEQAGYSFEAMTAFNVEQVNDSLKVAIFMEEPQNLAELRNAAPAAQFVVVTSNEQLQGEENLSVLYVNTMDQAFIAGMVTMLAAPDFRAGGLLVWDNDEQGADAQEAFVNGANYYCGTCASVYMPVAFFPIVTSLPSSSTWETWLDAFNSMNTEYIIYTMFVNGGAATTELMQALAIANVAVVGEHTPTGTDLPRYAATVQMDIAAQLVNLWPDLQAGIGGKTVVVPVEVVDVNEELLSAGRMRLVNDAIVLLAEGALESLSPD